MKSIFRKILSQKAIPWIGGVKDIFTMVVFYMSILNFTLVAIVAYNTGIRDWLLLHGMSWIKVYIWLGFMGLIALIAMILEYKFVYPSFYAFRSKQEYTHQSPLRADLAKVLKKLDDIGKRLDKLEGKGEKTNET